MEVAEYLFSFSANGLTEQANNKFVRNRLGFPDCSVGRQAAKSGCPRGVIETTGKTLIKTFRRPEEGHARPQSGESCFPARQAPGDRLPGRQEGGQGGRMARSFTNARLINARTLFEPVALSTPECGPGEN